MFGAHRIKQLKLVVIDKPINHFDQPLTQIIFSRLMSLKIAYNKEEYGDTCPVGKHEFVGRHHIICEVVGGDYFPLMAARVDSKEVCDQHDIDFAPRTFFSDTQSEATFDTITASDNKCSYIGSWCISPEHRNTALATKMNKIIGGVSVLDFLNSEYATIFTSSRFCPDMSTIFEMMGCEKVTTSNVITQVPTKLENSLYMSDRRYSEARTQLATKYCSYYEDRMELDPFFYSIKRDTLAYVS